MSIVTDNFAYELQFAACVAVTRYPTWEDYASGKQLARFSDAQVAEIKSVYDRWKKNDQKMLEAEIAAPVTTSGSN